ncbi:uncharacterized protein LOC127596069 isoform X1 [Hippocampus zosterae]|uniref:uncharacterized protein LOC127596069 isoform X1 n=1 Tax=Hippocampus zosterae TaxID=109293 RepID=UPI00223CA484|nr:uncharacterized protein LOC127596069 isoform X1 [Hippocampus zosterae]
MFPSVRLHHLASALTRLPARIVARALVCRRQLPKVPVKVLYDGLCPICVTEIRFLQFLQKNQPEKVEFLDISLPGYDGAKCKGVSFEAAMEEMHVIDERHQVHRGVPAFAVMYGAVGLGWLGRFMMWPPVRPFMDNFYAIFARNRLKWTGRGNECTTGRCQKKTP